MPKPLKTPSRMNEHTMILKILLPFKVFATVPEVKRVVVGTPNGYFGLLPRRLDCVAAVVPGILTYETAAGVEYVAVDRGILVKVGQYITLSVRLAVGGVPLDELHQAVKNEFLTLDHSEQEIRAVMAKLETSFIVSLQRFKEV
jgi:F-type H+-transporting ATPase subunit epsilon